jgi:hypothetical protein
MRSLVASLFTTLDGVVEAPENWQFRYFDDEMGEVIGAAAESPTPSCSAGSPTKSSPPSGRVRAAMSRWPTT